MDQPSEATAEVPRVWARPVVVMPVLALLSIVGGQLPSFSPQANFYVLSTGGTMIWLGLSARVPRRPAPPQLRPRASLWLVPIGLFAALEVATYLGRSSRYPTLSKVFDPLLQDDLVRSACYFGWLAAFWAMARR
jgi:hypothetical protein